MQNKAMSLPSWERGLKYSLSAQAAPEKIVAPLVGAWIEIPFADTIEKFSKLSLPSWERGLK